MERRHLRGASDPLGITFYEKELLLFRCRCMAVCSFSVGTFLVLLILFFRKKKNSYNTEKKQKITVNGRVEVWGTELASIF